MNKLCTKITVVFLIVSTIFFPYYWSFNDRYEKAFGFPYRYIYFNDMKISFFRSMNIDLSHLLMDFVIVYICVYVGAKIFKFIKKVVDQVSNNYHFKNK